MRGKFDFDVVGDYARPDVFSLTVDDSPQAPVRLGWEHDSAALRDKRSEDVPAVGARIG